VSAASVPATVTVRRLDSGEVLEVDPTALVWFRPLLYGATSLAFALTRKQPQEGDMPYLRNSSDSHWCLAVEIVEIPVPPPSNVLPFPLEARHG
jgi:hypothetical protein